MVGSKTMADRPALDMKRRRGDNNFINAINSISEADITK